MFCFKCGTKVEDDIKFCPVCGADLEEANDEATGQMVGEAAPKKKLSKKIIIIIVMVVIILAVIAAAATYFIVKYGCKYGLHDNHKWNEATCDLPMTCGVCGGTQGEKLGHDWDDGNCTTPKICKRCGQTKGDGPVHIWLGADCTNPKKCKRCNATEGEAFGHTWQDANCMNPKTCKRCERKEGNALGHDWEEANCTKPKTCKRCKATEGKATAHKWEEATCKKPKTCSVCGQKEGKVSAHKLDLSGKCTVCGYYDSSYDLSSKNVGDIVKLGSYEQDGNSSNGKEPIEWQVLAKENGRTLLISKYGLEAKQYDSGKVSTTWEKCSLRSWLNNAFYNGAFTSSEKKNISWYYTMAGAHENVFLLKDYEAEKYFGSDYSRMCKPTTHAKNNGVRTNGSKESCCWWLSSAGDTGFLADYVFSDGRLFSDAVFIDYYAVRPAMWITL